MICLLPQVVKDGDGDTDMGGSGSARDQSVGRQEIEADVAVDDADEAAEALIGLVGGGGGSAPMNIVGGIGGAPTGPGAKMGPGKVVWAKVEGHDWWPARVVRRRAVPREVSHPFVNLLQFQGP